MACGASSAQISQSRANSRTPAFGIISRSVTAQVSSFSHACSSHAKRKCLGGTLRHHLKNRKANGQVHLHARCDSQPCAVLRGSGTLPKCLLHTQSNTKKKRRRLMRFLKKQPQTRLLRRARHGYVPIPRLLLGGCGCRACQDAFLCWVGGGGGGGGGGAACRVSARAKEQGSQGRFFRPSWSCPSCPPPSPHLCPYPRGKEENPNQTRHSRRAHINGPEQTNPRTMPDAERCQLRRDESLLIAPYWAWPHHRPPPPSHTLVSPWGWGGPSAREIGEKAPSTRPWGRRGPN